MSKDDDYAVCEGCGKEIREGDKCAYDGESGIYDCIDCAATYADLLSEPDSFYNGLDDEGSPIYLTAETAKAMVDKHIAGGGNVTDKFALREY